MKLYIDTSDREKVVIGIDDLPRGKAGKRFEKKLEVRSSQQILPFIDQVLVSVGRNIKDIVEIEVNTGPGSFTGLRIGVAIANTFGWALKIPVNGKLVLTNPVEIVYK